MIDTLRFINVFAQGFFVGSMAGLATGERDALTRYTQALTGAFYFVPSIESLLTVSGQQPD